MWHIKGIVTDINEDLLYFKLNGSINVYMVLLFISGKFNKLPKIASEIEIELFHQHFSSTSTHFRTIILSTDCRIEGNFTNKPSTKSANFQKMVETNKFTPQDLLTIDNHLKIIEENFPIANVAVVDLITGILSVCRRKMLNCDLKTVNQLKFIENSRDLYKKFSYWTYGVHKIKEPLIAYLEFDSNYCSLLSNFNTRIPVIITNFNNIDCINRIVVIWNCRIITEIYNCEKFATIQYCLVDRNDIDVVDLQFDKKQIIDRNRFPCSFKFVILSKSSPMMMADRSIKLWLFVKNIGDKCDKILLLLDSCYSENFLNLQTGGVYTIFYKKNLTKIFYQNIHSLFPRFSQYFLEKDNGIIDCTRYEINENSIETVTETEALSQIASKNPISFRGRLTLKKFVEPLWSRTIQYGSGDHLGTPGNKTHLLEFQCDNKQRLTVYLNNFENLLRPHGLIPNMCLIVRNVIGHNGKYYKSTPFTTFEIVDYRPDIDFETACLASSPDWSRLCYLGLKLPIGVIIAATIFNVFLLGLSIKNQCLDCDSIVMKSECCRVCRSFRINFRTSATLLTSDYFGGSKIIAKDNPALELIKLLLGNYHEICDIIRNVGEYKYQCKRNLRPTNDNCLDEMCDNYNRKKNIDLQVKCRKLEDLQNGEALYFLLAIRLFYKL